MTEPTEPTDWLIWDEKSQLWWRENERGYTADFLQAGLYTRTRAMEIQRNAEASVGRSRQERAVPLAAHRERIEAMAQQIERLRAALAASPVKRRPSW